MPPLPYSSSNVCSQSRLPSLPLDDSKSDTFTVTAPKSSPFAIVAIDEQQGTNDEGEEEEHGEEEEQEEEDVVMVVAVVLQFFSVILGEEGDVETGLDGSKGGLSLSSS